MTNKNLKTKRRRLFFDIETSPNIGLFWEAGYKKNIDYSNIIQERAIICICYKWEDEKEVYALQWDAKQNDKRMLEQFIEVANVSNEMVGHNGDKFDLAWIRTRCLFHNISMFPKYTTIDTLKVARQKFRFNSNRLNYIADFLGLGTFETPARYLLAGTPRCLPVTTPREAITYSLLVDGLVLPGVSVLRPI